MRLPSELFQINFVEPPTSNNVREFRRARRGLQHSMGHHLRNR